MEGARDVARRNWKWKEQMGEEGGRYEGQMTTSRESRTMRGDEARCTLTSTEVHICTVSSGFRVPFIQSE